MPTPSRGAATNRPDTSPKAVAIFLREVAETLTELGCVPWGASVKEARALADALEQTDVSNPAFQGALTKDDWAERVLSVATRLDQAMIWTGSAWIVDGEKLPHVDAALRAFAPELVPSDD